MKKISIRSDITPVINELSKNLADKSIREKISYLAVFFNCHTQTSALKFVNETKGELHGAISIEVIDANFKKLNPNNQTKKRTNALSVEDEQQFKFSLSYRASLINFIMHNICNSDEILLEDLDFLFQNSSWVPDNYQIKIKRGILAAFTLDWMLFAEFILPAFETMLQHYLNLNQIPTAKHNKDGSQEEYSLDELFAKSEVIDLLGEDHIFELKFILTNKTGYGIRHSAAHGKIQDSDYV